MIAFFAEVKLGHTHLPAGACPAPVAGPGDAAAAAHRDAHRAAQSAASLVADPRLQSSFQELLSLIARQIDALAQDIAALIAADPLWLQLDRVFRSIKGVADRTVARLMADLPEIGTLSAKAISKLTGLAPLAQDSGCHRGKRAVRGGRASVREILFVVASVVGRYEQDFIAFRQRLLAAGKPPKVIRIALAHKLLVRLNAKAREVRAHLAVSHQLLPQS